MSKATCLELDPTPPRLEPDPALPPGAPRPVLRGSRLLLALRVAVEIRLEGLEVVLGGLLRVGDHHHCAVEVGEDDLEHAEDALGGLLAAPVLGVNDLGYDWGKGHLDRRSAGV